MAPKWFDIKDIPHEKMWQDAKFWHPYFFQRQTFKAYFLYDANGEILKHELSPTNDQ